MLSRTIHTILLVFIFFAVQAGPWPKNKGQGYFKLSEWWLISDQHFTDTGEIDPNTTNGLFSTTFYGEYGLTDRLTINTYFPIYSRAYFNHTVSGTTGEILIPGEAINSAGDAEIGLTYGIWKKGGTSISLTGKIGLPLGNSSGGTQGNLQTGDGEFNQALFLEAGTSFSLGSNSGWLSTSLGYNNRTKGFSDEWYLNAQLGMNLLSNKWTPSILLQSRQSLFNGDANLPLQFTSVFSNNTEYVSFTPEIAYHITPTYGVSAAVGMVVSGSIIFANPSYNIGFYYKLN